ncbi:MAG: transcriptional regulator, partial [Kordiimonas sp.]
MNGSIVLTESTHFWVGPWRIDPELNKISTSDKSVTVEPRAMRTLCYLHKRRGHTVSRDELLDKVWGKQALTDHAISVVIVSLRQALEDDAQNPRYLKTVRKKGYCLVETAEVSMVDDGVLARQPFVPFFYSMKASIGIALVAAIIFAVMIVYAVKFNTSVSKADPFVVSFSPVVQTKAVDETLTTVTNDLFLMELARYGRVIVPDRSSSMETANLYSVSASVTDVAGQLIFDMVAEGSDGISESMTARSQPNITAMASSIRSLVATMMAGHRVIAPKSKTRNDVEIILDRARYFWGFHRHDRNQLAYRMVKNLLQEYPANGEVHALLAEMYAALPGRVWGLDGVDTLALAEHHIQRAVELGADAKYVWRT